MKRNINSSLWAVAAFSASVGLGSVASSAHAAPFQPASVYDPDETGWSSLRDMTAAQFDAANEARKANNMMVDVDVVNVGGQLRYSTTRQYRVLTNGNPTTTTVTLDAVTLPRTSSGNWMLLAAGALLTLALGVHLLRWRLNLRPAPPAARR